MSRSYAGIGSRQTPPELLRQMGALAFALDLKGYTLRSGGADGADSAFEEETLLQCPEIFLPWRGFNGRKNGIVLSGKVEAQAALIAKEFHPAWDRLSQGAKKLHTRNVYQILGQDLRSPAAFVICWTKDGKATGGTGQAIRIADANHVSVFNLKREGDLDALLAMVRG